MAINWKLITHISGTKQHSILYRSKYKGKGVQREVHTPVRKNGFGKAKVYYFIDDDPREFRNEEELIKALEGSE